MIQLYCYSLVLSTLSANLVTGVCTFRLSIVNLYHFIENLWKHHFDQIDFDQNQFN